MILVDPFKRHGVFSRPASRAIIFFGETDALQHPFKRQITYRIALKVFFYFLRRILVCDELLTSRKINPVRAREFMGRAADPQMHFLGSGLSQTPHADLGSGAANNLV